MSELRTDLFFAMVGSCVCLTESSNPEHHDTWCPYKVLSEVADENRKLKAKVVKLAEINIAYINQLAEKDLRIETLEDLVRCRVEDETEFDTEWDTLARKALSAKDDEVKG